MGYDLPASGNGRGTAHETGENEEGEMMNHRTALLLVVAGAMGSCGHGCGDECGDGCGNADATEEAQATSFLGEPLHAPAPTAEDLEKHEQAKLAWQASPDDVELAIWHGRRTAYLGRYREAIDVYTEAIAAWPEDARLYRHRGHRYVSTRRLELAVRDFERAAELIEGTEDEVEPDGKPNARGIPVSSLHTNVWYHLGLARYLEGEYELAVEAYRRGLEASRGPDNVVSTTHWLYMALRRLGRNDDAVAALEPITADLGVIENMAYHRLCLFYGGELDEAELSRAEDGAVMNAATAYGLGNWHLAEGRTERAREIFEGILAQGQWAAFGHVAAEADLARGL